MSNKKTFKGKMKNVVLATLALATVANVCVVSTACGGGRAVDWSKTQFQVGNFNGGYGQVWIEEAAAIFEERYKDVVFEEGKTGVQIWVTPGKEEYQGYEFYTKISGMPQDFYVAPQPREEIINDKLLISLNDIMDESMEEFGETKTIRQKLSGWYKDSYLIEDVATPSEEPIYFLPTAEAYFGNIVYDIDLFETKSHYLKEGGGWTNGAANDKALGMDGVKGTYDDGLPTNEREFFALLDRIVGKGDVPFTWAGQYPAYMNAFVFNLFCNYDDGLGQELYNTLRGEYTFPGDSEPTVFNGYNIVDAQRLPGRLAALKVGQKIVENPDYYTDNAFKDTQSHTQAQTEFLRSVENEDRIAMLIEGSWWENEASARFEEMVWEFNNANYAKNTRRLGLMPTIRPNGAIGTKTSFITSAQALFINGNTKHVDLAKKFMKFLLSNEIRELFTGKTGCASPYEYTLSKETHDSLTSFGKCLWEVHQNKDNMYVFKTEHRTSAAYMINPSFYPYNFSMNATTSVPFEAFRTGVDAESYFSGMQTYAQTQYDEYFKKYVENVGE